MPEEQATTLTRRGDWAPDHAIEYPPVFVWPPRPTAFLRWFLGAPGYLLPFNALYALVAILVWNFATPSVATMSTWGVGWVTFVLARNAVLLVLWYSAFHVWLYVRKHQDTRFKYNPKWPGRGERFTFGSQTRENVFWTLASALPIWTAWEVVTLWLFSSGRIPWIDLRDHPIWFVALMLLVPLWTEVHFYTVHRLIHWPPLYKAVHSLHHRNTNPAPWSGLSMHPVEHLVYFSSIALFWVVPSHPVHALFSSFHRMMAPVPGHAGFDEIELNKVSLETGGRAHYLHHKYFEVNYADGVLPLDKWFGSFHDGTPEGDAAMKKRRLARAGRTSESADVSG
jgi:sterol desaturase/sphingolipid hydroxylase (fatty acid hydroxylase superfamily)